MFKVLIYLIFTGKLKILCFKFETEFYNCNKKKQRINLMHHKSKAKSVFKSVFFLIQTLVFVSSITMSIVSLTLYYKGRNILRIPLRYLFVSQLLCALSFTSSIVGFRTMYSKKRISLFFYIVFTIILMNLQVIVTLKSTMIPEKSQTWGDSLWNYLNGDQKSFIQNKFQCCGFNSPIDRPSGNCLYNTESCYKVLHGMSLGVRSFITKTMMFLFLTESAGLGIISLLKLRN